MERDRYYVVFHQRAWKIKRDVGYSLPFDTRRAAVSAAAEVAHRNRRPAEVLVEGGDDGLRTEWTTEWTFGADPFPLKG